MPLAGTDAPEWCFDVLVCREALTAFEPPKLRGDGLARFRSPREGGPWTGG
jgi:hypothetical protein